MQIMRINPENIPDLHTGNFMMRNNQLVILDPIHNEIDSNLNDDFAEFDRRWGGSLVMGKPGAMSKHAQSKRPSIDDDDEFDDEFDDEEL
jgi:hypothetical protein